MICDRTSGTKRSDLICLVLCICVLTLPTKVRASTQEELSEIGFAYSFVVAGHAYGSFDATNEGLYPKFLQSLKQHHDLQFVVFTGDIIRSCQVASWNMVEQEMSALALPWFLAPGNHDYGRFCIERLKEKQGGTFVRFDLGKARFIILDSQAQRNSISESQIVFLKQSIAAAPEVELIFVFFHELLWVGNNDRYKFITGNSKSVANRLKNANYWHDVDPVFQNNPQKRFYVFAGDTGHQFYSQPLFYQQNKQVTLVASGMGGVQDENFLKVKVDGTAVSIDVIPLNAENNIRELEFYGVENLSSVTRYVLAWFMQYLNFFGVLGFTGISIGLIVLCRRRLR